MNETQSPLEGVFSEGEKQVSQYSQVLCSTRRGRNVLWGFPVMKRSLLTRWSKKMT